MSRAGFQEHRHECSQRKAELRPIDARGVPFDHPGVLQLPNPGSDRLSGHMDELSELLMRQHGVLRQAPQNAQIRLVYR
ncbi:hypothetical protein D9M72_592420 [compost metagenome]